MRCDISRQIGLVVSSSACTVIQRLAEQMRMLWLPRGVVARPQSSRRRHEELSEGTVRTFVLEQGRETIGNILEACPAPKHEGVGVGRLGRRGKEWSIDIAMVYEPLGDRTVASARLKMDVSTVHQRSHHIPITPKGCASPGKICPQVLWPLRSAGSRLRRASSLHINLHKV
jgi:hypothetical protein